LTEYQRTIQSIHQQHQLLQELEQYKQRNLIVDEEFDEPGGGKEVHEGQHVEGGQHGQDEDLKNNEKKKENKINKKINEVKNEEIVVGVF
jgi:hypothetical protein